MGRTLGALGGLCLTVVAGCYSYHPVTVESVPTGAGVRARISIEEAERLSEVLGRDDRVLEGTVAGQEGGGLLLRVPSVAATTAGLAPQQLNQRVLVPSAGIVELEVRRLDRLRTGGLLAAATAVLGYAVYAAFDGNENPDGGSDKPGNERVLVPLRLTF